MRSLSKLIRFVLTALFSAVILGIVALGGIYFYFAPQLPSTDNLKDVRLQVPLRVFTRDGKVIAEFGEQRRIPVRFSEVPRSLIQAILAAEDDRFYTHPGVDVQGLLRASVNLLKTGEKSQGGSTITMQVARNFFLDSEKTYVRKFKEILLALKIESELEKDEILELYLNKIYLGNRSYGVAAAAQLYYGTTLDKLTIAQIAMLAGLPKAPSKYNPIVNLARATERRNYILGRMRELGYLDDKGYKTALASRETARRHSLAIEVEAPYVAEMVRAEMIKRYGDDAYTGGYRVFTTLDAELQKTANAALRATLIEYDMRHGYRKPARHVELPGSAGPSEWTRLLGDPSGIGGILPALVVTVGEKTASLFNPRTGLVEVAWEGLSWARPYISEDKRGAAPKRASSILAPGDIAGLLALPKGQWQLAQVPTVQGAMVSLTPNTAAVTSLVGGFYFYQSSFNRVMQADRQPGSSFKPFLYSAALEKGFTPNSIVNDAPLVIANANLGGDWRPENYSGKFNGPTSLRNALTHSRNLVSVRILRTIGIKYTIDYATRFGLKRERLPRGLSLALGSNVTTPMEMAKGYLIFANGGYQIEPYFIERIEALDGKILMQQSDAQSDTRSLQDAFDALDSGAGEATDSGETDAVSQDEGDPEPSLPDTSLEEQLQADLNAEISQDSPDRLGRLGRRVITPRNAYLMTSMMRDVVSKGTARRAMQLGRNDLAGKTGTTNEQRDAWFVGYNGDVVAAAWVGFDSHEPLGNDETGGHAALPMWMRFMSVALKDSPETPLELPVGLLADGSDPNQQATSEDQAVAGETRRARSRDNSAGSDGSAEQLF